MKKLFISCPMTGRSEKAIRKSMDYMHKEAERIFGEKLEVIDSYIQTTPVINNSGLWCLGASLQMMAEADYFIGITPSTAEGRYRGCYIEDMAATIYGIPTTFIPLVDILKAAGTPDEINLNLPRKKQV